MDMRKIKKLIELIQKTGVAEIEISEGDQSVRITREVHREAQTQTIYAPPPAAPNASASPSTPETKKEPEAAPKVDQHAVKAPMVGTVYLSPTPGTKPFVEIGQSVKAGDVLCLIEAMKMFNQIEADKPGIIASRLVDNGTPVEYNQPLFVIE